MTLSGDALSLSTGLFDVSRAASATVRSARAGLGEQAASAAEAVRRAAADPGRAAVILLPDEVPGALSAITFAAASHAPVVVHVPFVPGDDTSVIAPLCETGAAVVSTWSGREAASAAIALHRAAHDSEMPFVHLHDGPDPAGVAASMDQASIDALLGHVHPRAPSPPEADRSRVRSFAARVPFALAAAFRAASERSGSPPPLLERFETADADEVVVTYGRTFGVACGVAKTMRAAGRKVGVLGVRALRPFLAADVVKAIARARAAVVIEPLDPALDPTGPLAACVKGAFLDALTWAPGFPGVGRVPPVVSVTSAQPVLHAADVEAALAELSNGERARRVLVLGSEG
jgi:pyruvate ferredoxin oxidoreductase alpha subunit